MRTRPPDLTDRDIADALRAGWAIDTSSTVYLPVGFGSHHWRADGAGGRWFVTVDDLDVRRFAPDEPRARTFARLNAALRTASALRGWGLEFIVAPIRATEGAVLRSIHERWSIAVCPWLDVVPRAPRNPGEELEAIAAVHAAPADVRAMAERETFTIQARADLDAALADFDRAWVSGPYAERLRTALASRREEIEAALARHDEVARDAATRPDRFVLTHGEPHRENMLQTRDGLRIIDWDTTLLAPPERDVWILQDGDPAAPAAYTAATGRSVDPALLGFYRRAWRLTDLATFTAVIRAPHEDTDDVRKAFEGIVLGLGNLSR